MESIGVRELRQHASRWLARVVAGESFTITDRGRPIASLAPLVTTDWGRLTAAGSVLAARSRLSDVSPLQADGVPTLTAILAEDRDDSR